MQLIARQPPDSVVQQSRRGTCTGPGISCFPGFLPPLLGSTITSSGRLRSRFLPPRSLAGRGFRATYRARVENLPPSSNARSGKTPNPQSQTIPAAAKRAPVSNPASRDRARASSRATLDGRGHDGQVDKCNGMARKRLPFAPEDVELIRAHFRARGIQAASSGDTHKLD